MRQAYGELHRLGHAHSVEVWLADPGGNATPRLVGGLYGILLGKVFFGESMFSTATDASKVALHWLVHWGRAERGVELVDCQVANDHLFTLGARLIPRSDFVAQLERLIPRPGPATSANRT
jgi:leucyl/phenylalanyl-tRNA--protein transferase